jgi:hypothetical protein
MLARRHSGNASFGLAKLVGGVFDCWILDSSGEVLDSYAPGGGSAAVQMRCGKIAMSDPLAQRALERLFKRVPAATTEQWGCIVGPHRPIRVLIKFLIFDQAQQLAFQGASIAVIAFSKEIRCRPSSELLRVFLGLTPAEARVLTTPPCSGPGASAWLAFSGRF